MTSQGSITGWIEQVRQGDDAAAQELWDRYFPDLIRLARHRLQTAPCGVADEEDVVLSAFDSFFRRVRDNRQPELKDRDDLWRILSQKTRDKAVDLIRYNCRQKRGGEGVGAGVPAPANRTADAIDPGELADHELSPDLIVLVDETCRTMLDGLPDDQMRQIAVSRMEGWTNREIAGRIGCSVATVERRLHLIRRLWQAQTEP